MKNSSAPFVWILVVNSFFFTSLADGQQNNFKISGKLETLTTRPSMLYLVYSVDGKRVRDSTKIVSDTYSFEGYIDVPVMSFISPKYDDPKKIPALINVFLDKSPIEVISRGEFTAFSVRNSPAHLDYEKMVGMYDPISEKEAEVRKKREQAKKDNNEELLKQYEQEIQEFSNERKAVPGKFAEKNPSSPVAMHALNMATISNFDVDWAESVYTRMPEWSRNSYLGKNMALKIEKGKVVVIGNKVPDFTQNDPSGKPISLSSFRGKYVLIDFWASWCIPCRKANPALVKAYANYKHKGFEILGVSLERPGEKEKWLEAIQKDGLTWTHVSDLKFFDNEVAKQYGITAIPQSLLLDPNGVIIAKNLREEELEQKLKEVFRN